MGRQSLSFNWQTKVLKLIVALIADRKVEFFIRPKFQASAVVIIAGGQLFGPIFQRHKFFTIPNTGVPVVEVSACGLKLAQALAELARTVSLRKSEHVNAPFRTPPREVVDEMRRKFGIV